jgi:membrane fusion protein (multidrug efflux system)
MRHVSLFKLATPLVVVALAACGPDKGSAPGAPQGGPGAAPPPPEVNVLTVQSGPVELTSELSGRVQSTRSAVVRARVEGVVQKVLFTEGSDVQPGTPLFEIDPRTYRAALDAAKADAQAAEQSWQRNQSLLKDKAISQQDYDASLARYKQTQSALSKAELDFENAMVVAPIAGRIGHSLVTEGTLVGRGESTPLVSIDQLDPVWVNFTQTESEWLALRRAMDQGELKANATWRVDLIQADGRPYPLPGRLKVAERTVDPNTGGVFLRAEFPNPKYELMPGSFVRVRLSQASMPSALTVPQRAVLMNAQGPYVMLLAEGNKVVPKPIQTGAMSGDRWVVNSGLQAGMRIVVDGLQKARPGTVVNPVEANPVK